jgi:hypothetical protein
MLPATRRELDRIATALLPVASEVRRMTLTLDEMVAEAQESALAAEQEATRIVRLGGAALAVVEGGRQ